MLVARCAFCGWTGPLGCAGKFMPHPPMYIELTTAGPTCPACGPWPNIFTCPFMHTQYLYVPGVSPMPQQGYSYAAVAQVQPGASNQTIMDAIKDVVGHAASSVGEGAVEGMFGQFQ